MRLDRLLDADRQDRGLCARKQDVDQALLRKEGCKQFLGEPGRFGQEQVGPAYAGKNPLDDILLQGFGKVIDVVVMQVEGGLADFGTVRQFPDGDPLERFVRPQREKSVADGLAGFDFTAVHGNLLFTGLAAKGNSSRLLDKRPIMDIMYKLQIAKGKKALYTGL